MGALLGLSARRRRALASRIRGDLEPALEPAAPVRLDLRRRPGLPILPSLARHEELRHGSINHALRVTVPRTRRSFAYPARHFASSLTDRDLPPMGLHLRLRASVNVGSFRPQSRAVLTALRRYGMIIADNGSPWYVTGAPSTGWNDDDLHALHGVRGRDFEVVDTRSLPRPGL